ncbi:MAG: hypothetical protein D6707_04565 [Bacteroidetes bacterium]|nr:MAG: hypothetical protein D6707_04565 [Bacteroidota bacterium]
MSHFLCLATHFTPQKYKEHPKNCGYLYVIPYVISRQRLFNSSLVKSKSQCNLKFKQFYCYGKINSLQKEDIA